MTKPWAECTLERPSTALYRTLSLLDMYAELYERFYQLQHRARGCGEARL